VHAHELGEQYGDFAQQDHTLKFGMWVFLASEVLLFAALFALYAAYRTMYVDDFRAAIEHNTLAYGTVNMFVLLVSSFTVALSVWAVRHGRNGTAVALQLATIALGIAFLIIKLLEYAEHFHERALPGRYYHMTELPTFGASLRYFGSHLRNLGKRVRTGREPVVTDPVLASRARLKSTAITALRRYIPTPCSDRVCIFLPNKAWLRSGAAPHRWLRVAPQAEFYFGPDECNETRMLEEPDAPAIAALYRRATQKLND